MDGVHIPIHEPFENGAHYVNHKSFHSINLLGGSVHDARMYYHFSLYHEILLHPKQWVSGGSYIIADVAYPLCT
ncbi:hypothetical protein C1646_714270, partial [Rhizophagus diaphanus]